MKLTADDKRFVRELLAVAESHLHELANGDALHMHRSADLCDQMREYAEIARHYQTVFADERTVSV